MTKNIFKRGFTLIELLVVIAIIGILAAVVLASLNSARDKGEDAAAKASLNNSRAQAELYYDDNGRTYTTVCTTGTNNIADLITSAGDAVSGTADCFDTDAGWAAGISLNSGQYYCVDYTGYAGEMADPTLADSNLDCQ